QYDLRLRHHAATANEQRRAELDRLRGILRGRRWNARDSVHRARWHRDARTDPCRYLVSRSAAWHRPRSKRRYAGPFWRFDGRRSGRPDVSWVHGPCFRRRLHGRGERHIQRRPRELRFQQRLEHHRYPWRGQRWLRGLCRHHDQRYWLLCRELLDLLRAADDCLPVPCRIWQIRGRRHTNWHRNEPHRLRVHRQWDHVYGSSHRRRRYDVQLRTTSEYRQHRRRLRHHRGHQRGAVRARQSVGRERAVLPGHRYRHTLRPNALYDSVRTIERRQRVGLGRRIGRW